MVRFPVLFCALLLAGISWAVPVRAQSEGQLKQYFEGLRVIAKIDMPATKDGVDVYPQRPDPINDGEYFDRLNRFGAAIRSGDEVVITKVKVKGKHIEFQLDGGGYGTFWDESATVSPTPVEESRREKRLEKRLKEETDERRRRWLKSELRDLRDERSRQEEINREEAERLSEEKAEIIAERAIRSGSRFNIKFEMKLSPAGLTVEMIKNSLGEYLDFARP